MDNDHEPAGYRAAFDRDFLTFAGITPTQLLTSARSGPAALSG